MGCIFKYSDGTERFLSEAILKDALINKTLYDIDMAVLQTTRSRIETKLETETNTFTSEDIRSLFNSDPDLAKLLRPLAFMEPGYMDCILYLLLMKKIDKNELDNFILANTEDQRKGYLVNILDTKAVTSTLFDVCAQGLIFDTTEETNTYITNIDKIYNIPDYIKNNNDYRRDWYNIAISETHSTRYINSRDDVEQYAQEVNSDILIGSFTPKAATYSSLGAIIDNYANFSNNPVNSGAIELLQELYGAIMPNYSTTRVDYVQELLDFDLDYVDILSNNRGWGDRVISSFGPGFKKYSNEYYRLISALKMEIVASNYISSAEKTVLKNQLMSKLDSTIVDFSFGLYAPIIYDILSNYIRWVVDDDYQALNNEIYPDKFDWYISTSTQGYIGFVRKVRNLYQRTYAILEALETLD